MLPPSNGHGQAKIRAIRKRTYNGFRFNALLFDKLYMLWTLCLIAHRRERGQSLAVFYIEQDYGKEILETWFVYLPILEAHGFFDTITMQLTEKGQLAAANWRKLSDYIYAI